MACQPVLPWSAVAALLLAMAAWPVQAQVYNFDETPVPSPHSMSVYHVFYVYGQRDAPGSAPRAQATVEFRELAAFKNPGGSQPTRNYSSVEVAILRWETFWYQVDKQKFCSSQKASEAFSLMLQGSLDTLGVWFQGVPFPAFGGTEPRTVLFPIKKSGKYVLILANCGNFSEATVSGSLAVRSAHGYLPAYEFNTMRVDGWSAVAYTVICMVWLIAVVRYFKGLVRVQQGIGVVALVCLLEAFFAWAAHRAWNVAGVQSSALLCLRVLFYTLKYTCSLVLLILEPLGVGPWNMVLQSTLLMIQGCVWRSMMSCRFSDELDRSLLLVGALPGVAVCAAVLAWASAALSRLLRDLRKQKQEELAMVFGQVRLVLAFGTFLSTISTTVQVVDIWRGPFFSWRLAWLPVDGAPQFSFMAALVAMMVVWWPGKESLRGVVQTSCTREGEPAQGAKEEPDGAGLIEEGRRERRSGGGGREASQKRSAVKPEAIGAAEAEEAGGEDGEAGAMVF